MTENHVQWSATRVTTHSYTAEARAAPDNAAVTGRACTQKHHVLSFRVKGKESLRSPRGASGEQSGIWLGASPPAGGSDHYPVAVKTTYNSRTHDERHT